VIERQLVELQEQVEELKASEDGAGAGRELAIVKTKLEEAELWTKRANERATQAAHARPPH
jgi:hypothetical protein